MKDINHFIFKHFTLTRKLRSYHLSKIVSDISEFLFLNWNYYKTCHYKVRELILSGDIVLKYSLLGNTHGYQRCMHKSIQEENSGKLYPVLTQYQPPNVSKGHLKASMEPAGRPAAHTASRPTSELSSTIPHGNRLMATTQVYWFSPVGFTFMVTNAQILNSRVTQ